ncbi:MAG: SPOR domain-containing protein [Bacteroidota bacterium]
MNTLFSILVLFFTFVSFASFGQPSQGKIIVPQNRIYTDTLEDNRGIVSFSVGTSIQNIEKEDRGKYNIEGYRVQIYFGGDLNQAKKVRQEFISAGNAYGAYLEQNIPDFSLRIGDFLTEAEAKMVLKQFIQKYPGAFVVKSKIQPPKLEPYFEQALDE